MKRITLLLAASLIVLALVLATEITLYTTFGWVPFLWRVVPRMAIDSGSVLVGVLALLLFASGVHWAGRAWTRDLTDTETPRRWRVRTSLSVLGVVTILFASGTALVGLVHQLVWLRTSGEPVTVPSLHRFSDFGTKTNDLKMISMGLHGYASMHNGQLPPGGTFATDGTMRHSWETHILMDMGYWERIDRNLPWNASENAPYFRSIVPQFINPELESLGHTDADGFALSHYAANVHVMSADSRILLTDITDTSNTILIGEVNTAPMAWGHPVNWRDPTLGINRSPQGFGGPPHSGGATFLMADGSVRFVSEKVNPDVIRALSSPRGK